MKMYNIRLDEDIINRFKKRAELNDMSQAELFNEMSMRIRKMRKRRLRKESDALNQK